MYTNIILNTLPLRKIYGIPFLIVHSEMQFFIRIFRMDVIAKIVLTRGNTIFWFTSSTFIFDRGKSVTFSLYNLPVNMCNKIIHCSVGIIVNRNLNSLHLILPWVGTIIYVYIPSRLRLYKLINRYHLRENSKTMSNFSIELLHKFSVGVSWLIYISSIRICKLNSLIRKNVSYPNLIWNYRGNEITYFREISSIFILLLRAHNIKEVIQADPCSANQEAILSLHFHQILRLINNIHDIYNMSDTSSSLGVGSQSGGYHSKAILNHE
jgi:hypothetical protein